MTWLHPCIFLMHPYFGTSEYMTASILYDSDRLLHHRNYAKVRAQSINKTFPDGTEALRSC